MWPTGPEAGYAGQHHDANGPELLEQGRDASTIFATSYVSHLNLNENVKLQQRFFG